MNEDTPTNAAAGSSTKPLGEVIAINEGLIKDHLNKVVITSGLGAVAQIARD